MIADITGTAIIALIVGIAPLLLKNIAWLLISITFNVIHVIDSKQVAFLDAYLGKYGYCSIRKARIGSPPSWGPHLLFMHGIIVAIKNTTENHFGTKEREYTLYVFGRQALKKINKMLLGKEEEICMKYVYAPTPYRTSIQMMRMKTPTIPRPEQKETVSSILNAFLKHRSASALICGAPGVGKSTVGALVAAQLKNKETDPIVIEGFDPTSPGLMIDDVFDPLPSKLTPVILMLNEYETAVERASEETSSHKEATCHAENKASLTHLLDRLSKTEDLIVIATSNSDLNTFELKAKPYCRRGRLDMHFILIKHSSN